jgi:hypothetical protein
MGVMSLANFRDDLRSALGGRIELADPRLTVWVNVGYFDVAGAVDFHQLFTHSDVNTVIGTAEYDIPAGVVSIRTLYDKVAKNRLGRLEIPELFRLDQTVAGVPKKYARVGNKFILNPVPADVRAIEVVGFKEPAPLAADADVTVLPRTWDVAILMLATSHALLILNEEQRSAFWQNKALAYIESRLIEGATATPARGQ